MYVTGAWYQEPFAFMFLHGSQQCPPTSVLVPTCTPSSDLRAASLWTTIARAVVEFQNTGDAMWMPTHLDPIAHHTQVSHLDHQQRWEPLSGPT